MSSGDSGARSALSACFREHQAMVHGVAYSRCGDASLAEEITAQTFEAAARQYARGRGGEVTAGWLTVVAKRRLVDHWRHMAARSRAVERLAGAHPQQVEPVSDGIDSDILAALDSLPARQRTVLLPPPADPAADNSDRAGGPPADAAAVRDHIAALADQGFFSAPRALDTTASLLGQPTTLLEFDVPNGAEVYPAFSEPDGWSGLKLYTLGPGRTYRLWTVDIGDQVAIVLASADTGNTADLDQATAWAETVMAAFHTD